VTPEVAIFVGQLFSQRDLKQKLNASFKQLDYAQNGFVSKEDFINVLFEIASGCLLPNQILNIANHYAASESDVNYNFFL
jgi:Ca2+-binding EF-hand superfamily protein